MAFDYSGIVATASDLINKFGKTTAIVRVLGAATEDPAAGTISHAASTDTPANAVEVEHNEFYSPGAVIQDEDKFFVLDTLANPEDELVINDTTLNIVQVWPVKSGDTFIACRVQVRGGVVDATAGTAQTAASDAFDYSGIATTASDLIGYFGKSSAVLKSLSSPTVDGAAGTVTGGTTSETAIEAVQIAHNERYVPGALIETDDKFWALDTLASVNDEIADSESQYKVVRVWRSKPGDTFIACRVQTRGGITITTDNVYNLLDRVINGADNVVNG